MPDQPEPVSRPRRPYLRFSVCALIVLVLAIGAGLGWIVNSARIQRDAVKAIETGGRTGRLRLALPEWTLRPERKTLGAAAGNGFRRDRLFRQRHIRLSQEDNRRNNRTRRASHSTRRAPFL